MFSFGGVIGLGGGAGWTVVFVIGISTVFGFGVLAGGIAPAGLKSASRSGAVAAGIVAGVDRCRSDRAEYSGDRVAVVGVWAMVIMAAVSAELI